MITAGQYKKLITHPQRASVAYPPCGGIRSSSSEQLSCQLSYTWLWLCAVKYSNGTVFE